MVDLIDEIRDEVKKDNLAAFWKRFGKLIILGLVAIIVATAAFSWWKVQKTTEQKEVGRALYKLNQAAQMQDSDSVVTLADAVQDKAKAQVFAIASLREAALLVQTGEVDKAITLYDETIAKSDKKSIYANLAKLLKVSLEEGEGKDALLADVVNAEDGWHYLALEQQVLGALEQGDKTKALELIAVVEKDAGTPDYMKSRLLEVKTILEDEVGVKTQPADETQEVQGQDEE